MPPPALRNYMRMGAAHVLAAEHFVECAASKTLHAGVFRSLVCLSKGLYEPPQVLRTLYYVLKSLFQRLTTFGSTDFVFVLNRTSALLSPSLVSRVKKGCAFVKM